MKKLSDLTAVIDSTLSTNWQSRAGLVVPSAENINLGNDAVELEGTVLYADLADSTGLVQDYKAWFAAEIYKTYLVCTCEIIKNNGGVVTAFDGDRVMAVFIGTAKNSNAARTALQINHMVLKEINPRIKKKYPTSPYILKQAVGIDTSTLFVAKTGIRGSNDLVWVGRAANYAAKLCGLRDDYYVSFITADVYSRLSVTVKEGGSPSVDMWTKFIWADTGIVGYKSGWSWLPD